MDSLLPTYGGGAKREGKQIEISQQPLVESFPNFKSKIRGSK
jgi:hypothetical protein